MRSATSRPLFLRASWISRIASRARPAWRSSAVISRSRATVAPESEATDQPSRGVSVMMTSSGARVTVSPSTSTDAVPSRRARDSAAASASATAFATVLDALAEPLAQRAEVGLGGGVDQRAAHLGEGRQGADVQLLRDLRVQFAVEGVEAGRRDQRAGQRLAGLHARLRARGPAQLHQPAYQHHLLGQLRVDRGQVRLRPGRSGAPTPGRPGSTGTTRSCQTRSVMNGVSGAISRVTVSTTSCRVRSAALSPCQKRRRERRTYQLDRSSTNADSSLPARWVS